VTGTGHGGKDLGEILGGATLSKRAGRADRRQPQHPMGLE